MCKIRELEAGKTGRLDAVLIKDIKEKKAKNGKSYCVLTLTDGTEDINVKFWEKRIEDIKVAVKTVISADIECQEYQGGKTYVLRAYGPVEMDPSEFVKKAPGNPEKMLLYIRSQLKDLPEDVKKVTEYLLDVNEDKFLQWPAACTVHHAYENGLLFHITRCLFSVIPLAKNYGANVGLVTAGVILHDVGKLREIECDPDGCFKFSDDGKMFGHVVLGLRMLDEAAAACGVDLNSENMKILANIICSHHMTAEHGAIAKPVTKESYIVSMIDNLDAKLDIFDSTLDTINPGSYSDRIKYLDGANVYSPTGDTAETA